MNITLRKANAIQTSINDVIKTIEFNTSVSINEFQTANDVITAAEVVFTKNMQRRDALYLALYEIRKLVSKGNDISTISEKLADVAHLDKQISFFGGLASKPIREADAVINGKLEKIRNRKEESRASLYGVSDEVSTSILDKEDLDGFRVLTAMAKKQKQKLQDEILEMNVRTEVPLSQATVQTLQAEGII